MPPFGRFEALITGYGGKARDCLSMEDPESTRPTLKAGQFSLNNSGSAPPRLK
jgi:hypothetical protein